MNIDSILGGAIIMAGAAASAVTGGASAGGGETVITGDSYSSVQVTNVINAGSEGGTSHTVIETSIDGEVHTETKDESFASGEDIVVEVFAHASSTSGTSTDAESRTNFVMQVISQLLHTFFGMFFK